MADRDGLSKDAVSWWVAFGRMSVFYDGVFVVDGVEILFEVATRSVGHTAALEEGFRQIRDE